MTAGSTLIVLSIIALGELAMSHILNTVFWKDLLRGFLLGAFIAIPAFYFTMSVLRQNMILSRKFRSAYRMATRNAEDVINKNQELEAAQMRLAELANSDFLTGLANRRRFEQSFADAFGAAGLGGSPFTLVLLDLDNFKQINDVHGHDAGDAVLRHVAVRMRKALGDRPGIGARLGGDEFALLLWDTFDGAEVAEFAAELQEMLALPHAYRGTLLDASSTVSVGFYSAGFKSASEMFVATDNALMMSKRKRDGHVAIVDSPDTFSLAG